MLALRRLGVDAQTSQDWLTPTVQAAFEDAYGERIRAARPGTAQPPPVADSQASPDPQEPPALADDAANERVGRRDAFSPMRVGGAFKTGTELTAEQIAQRAAQRARDRKYAVPKKQAAGRFPAKGVERIYLGGSPGSGRRS